MRFRTELRVGIFKITSNIEMIGTSFRRKMENINAPGSISEQIMLTIYDMARVGTQDDKADQGFTFNTDFGRSNRGEILKLALQDNRIRQHNSTQTLKNRFQTEGKSLTTHEGQNQDDVRDTFRKFTQRTTFHGIRYIFDGKNLQLRK